MRTIREGARMGNVQENWLVRLYYDTETSTEWLGVADHGFKGSTGNQYHPLVSNIGSIRESLDLAKCTSKVSNLSVTLANVTLDGTRLSETLSATSGSEVFLNRKVEIYSMLNGQDEILHSVIYTGRLRGITWTDDEVQLDIEPNQPWDFLSIPNTQADSGRYFPVVYGDYTANASTPGSEALCTSLALWPVEIDTRTGGESFGLVHQSIASGGKLHFYEESTDSLVPVTDSSDATTDASATYRGGYAMPASTLFRHAWKFKAEQYEGSETNDFTNAHKATDYKREADTSYTSANDVLTVSPGSGDTGSLPLNFPRLGLKMTGVYTVTVVWTATASSGTPTGTMQLSASDSSISGTTSMSVGGGQQSYTFTGGVTGDAPPEWIKVTANGAFYAGGTVDITVRIWDVIITTEVEIDTSGDATAQARAVEGVDMLYCGADGFAKSWSSGACDTVQEIHRDMLTRFAGLSTSTPDGYPELDTARSGWSGRLWLHEPEELRKVLEQLQYEGQFIFAWASDGDPKYIYVKSSYSSGDVSATITPGRDTSAIQYSLTPFSDIVSKQELKYERHPADDSRYLSAYTKTNSDRSNFNFDTLENIEQIELDYLVDSVDDHATITDLVFGAPKRLISCQLYRPELFTLEIGDIVQLENDAAYYMITDVTRSQGKFTIKAREVG